VERCGHTTPRSSRTVWRVSGGTRRRQSWSTGSSTQPRDSGPHAGAVFRPSEWRTQPPRALSGRLPPAVLVGHRSDHEPPNRAELRLRNPLTGYLGEITGPVGTKADRPGRSIQSPGSSWDTTSTETPPTSIFMGASGSRLHTARARSCIPNFRSFAIKRLTLSLFGQHARCPRSELAQQLECHPWSWPPRVDGGHGRGRR
jgi:hypothetical protein